MTFPWTAPDGLTLPASRWVAEGGGRVVVVCVHGLGGADWDFHRLGPNLAARGMEVFAMNLRGHGNDPDIAGRGSVLDRPAIRRDVAAFVEFARRELPGRPVVLCGESLGALLVLDAVVRGPLGGLTGAILSVPVVTLRRRTPWIVRQVVHWLGQAAPGLRFHPQWFVSGDKAPLVLTRDHEHSAAARKAPHRIPAFTFRFLDQLATLMTESYGLAEEFDVPCLVLAGGRDPYLSVEQMHEWFERLLARDKTFRDYPESLHLLWNDLDRDRVMDDIAAWIDTRVEAAVSATA